MIVTTATDWTGKPEEVTVSTGESVDWNAGATISAAPVHRRIRKPAMICPISQGAAAAARTYGTVVTLMGAGTDTQGAVHCHQLKSLDWRARNVRLKETVPQYIVDEALARIEAILFE